MMDKLAEKTWHGMPQEAIEANQDRIPAREPAGKFFAPPSGYRYPKVYFSGNYGALCGEFQEFWRQNITKDTAAQVAWSAFGLCGHSIRYYDDNGQEIG